MCARYGSKAQKRHAALELSLAIRVGQELRDRCPRCRHKHLDRSGALGCWACQCDHPAQCRCAGCNAQRAKVI